MSRWKIVGVISLLFLLLFAFVVIESCRRVNEPQRAEEAPEDLQSHVVEQAHPSLVRRV